jgi:NADH-quinone oxidoreductase subunit J
MTLNLVLFFILAAVAVISALAMLFSRNAVYSALYLIVNFCTVAVFYLLLQAPFIAIAQVTVYAGAIMVLFLFVIMMLSAEQTGQTAPRWWYQPLALILGGVLLAETLFIVISQGNTLLTAAAPLASFSDPKSIGKLLFSEYLLPFEVTSILLLVAMVGAIVMTKEKEKRNK